MEERLRGEDLADRRGERRRADLGADPRELVEHLVEPVAAALERAGCASSAATSPAGRLVLGRADGDPRRERRDRLVADVLVDEVGRLPERGDVDAGVEAEPGERLRERLARDAVQRRARPGRRRRRSGRRRRGGLERGGERVARPRPGSRGRRAGRSPRRARATSSARAVRLERAGRVVQRATRAAPSSGSFSRLLDERVASPARPGCRRAPPRTRARPRRSPRPPRAGSRRRSAGRAGGRRRSRSRPPRRRSAARSRRRRAASRRGTGRAARSRAASRRAP